MTTCKEWMHHDTIRMFSFRQKCYAATTSGYAVCFRVAFFFTKEGTFFSPHKIDRAAPLASVVVRYCRIGRHTATEGQQWQWRSGCCRHVRWCQSHNFILMKSHLCTLDTYMLLCVIMTVSLDQMLRQVPMTFSLIWVIVWSQSGYVCARQETVSWVLCVVRQPAAACEQQAHTARCPKSSCCCC